MNYGLLRKGLIDAISFDAISVKRELLQEYFYRLDEMQNNSEGKDTDRKVALDFYDKYVKGRTYKVRMNGKVYLLVTTQKTRGKLMSSIRRKDRDHYYKMTKQLLICLASLDEILLNGQKSASIPTDDFNEHHKDSEWIYVQDEIIDPVFGGKVIAQLEFFKNNASRIYHITIEGGKRFDYRMGQFIQYRPKTASEIVHISRS